MKYKTKLALQIGLLFLCVPGYGQEEEKQDEEHSFHHAIAVVLSHSYISQGIVDGNRRWLNVPSWGLNYNYRLGDKWFLGWHNDIIIEEFVVEDTREETEELERDFPISSMIVGTFKPNEHWGFALGAGAEWEKDESFALIRVGAEYSLPLKVAGLEIMFTLNYDILVNAYDSMNLGIGIVKLF